jgi:hypothetical protein
MVKHTPPYVRTEEEEAGPSLAGSNYAQPTCEDDSHEDIQPRDPFEDEFVFNPVEEVADEVAESTLAPPLFGTADSPARPYSSQTGPRTQEGNDRVPSPPCPPPPRPQNSGPASRIEFVPQARARQGGALPYESKSPEADEEDARIKCLLVLLILVLYKLLM